MNGFKTLFEGPMNAEETVDGRRRIWLSYT